MKNRRSLTLFFFALFLLIGINSCKDEKETFTVYPQPNWEVIKPESYEATMTAMVAIPDFITPYVSEGDELAAFTGETCRGVGYIINGMYFITIKGSPEEEVDIYFQYYNGRNKYLYKTPVLFKYEKDKVLGSADNPLILPLSVVE